ncbi:MAG: LysM peptidoglycan-binding domain-containing protein [Verrucomicrobiota bacterium]
MSKSVPERVKPKAAVATAKNPPAVTQEAKTGSGAEEELRRRFLAAAGKTAEPRSKPIEAQKPQATAAPVAPKPVVATRADTVPAPAPRPTRPTATHYTLTPGDNLYMVSRKLGVSYNYLAKANGIRDPRQLRVGQTLKVPGGSAM